MGERHILPGAVCNCEKQNPNIVWARDIRMCDCMVKRGTVVNRLGDYWGYVWAAALVLLALAGIAKWAGWLGKWAGW